MAHSFNDVKFATEISKRTVKNSFSVGVFLNTAENFIVKYVGSDGQEIETTYLAVKMIGVAKESLWLGYKVKEVLGGEKVEIDVTSLLWIYIDSTILKKQIRVNKLEEYSVASILRNSDKDLPIKIGETAKNIDYHTRCIKQLNNTINDIYSKARVHSFLKMLTHFSVYEYDFLKSEYADESTQDASKFILKTRFVPLNINLKENKTQNAVSIYINSLKDGAKHVGLWLVAPVKDNGFLDADKLAFVSGLSLKNISVNSTASTSNQIEVKYLPKDILSTKDNDGGLEEWLSQIFDKFGVSKFVASSNVKDFVEKFEKSKDLLAQEIIESVYFSNIESFAGNTVKFTDNQAKEVGLFEKPVKQIQTKPNNTAVEVSEDEVNNVQIVDSSAQLDKVVIASPTTEKTDVVADNSTSNNTYAQVGLANEVSGHVLSDTKDGKDHLFAHIIKESIDEDGYWSFKKVDDQLLFEHTLLHCQISFSVSNMLDHSNKIFNEMLQLSIDPYTIKDAFDFVGHKFKQYSYKQVRKLITEVPDEVLENYIDLENYYDLVEAEKHDRSIKKG